MCALYPVHLVNVKRLVSGAPDTGFLKSVAHNDPLLLRVRSDLVQSLDNTAVRKRGTVA